MGRLSTHHSTPAVYSEHPNTGPVISLGSAFDRVDVIRLFTRCAAHLVLVIDPYSKQSLWVTSVEAADAFFKAHDGR